MYTTPHLATFCPVYGFKQLPPAVAEGALCSAAKQGRGEDCVLMWSGVSNSHHGLFFVPVNISAETDASVGLFRQKAGEKLHGKPSGQRDTKISGHAGKKIKPMPLMFNFS